MKSQGQLIRIPQGEIGMEGVLVIPRNAKGIVLLAHGSGSGRLSPRNNFVADILNKEGFATLLIDLLTHDEDNNQRTRFDIPLLSLRLEAAVLWLKENEETLELPIGLFGASTGAAAALETAAAFTNLILAVVSRGGRPDLAKRVIGLVEAPTLLIVGGNDHEVVDLNLSAYEELSATKEIQIVPGATHLFEEPGTLEEVARLAKEWFGKYLKATTFRK